jgi:hypothetical protein
MNNKIERELKERFDKIDKLKEDILNPDLSPQQKLEKIEDYEKKTLGHIPNIANIIDNIRKGPMFINQQVNSVKKTNG